MKQLRLLLFKDCNRKCKGCCNKEWNLDNLATCKTFKGYDNILLTGGEPLLRPDIVIKTIRQIKRQNKTAKIYMYTAKPDIFTHYPMMSLLDGITLTLHSQSDVHPFVNLNKVMQIIWKKNNRPHLLWSLRLNVFKGIKLPDNIDLTCWNVRLNIKWLKNCPLPKQEVFMKLN